MNYKYRLFIVLLLYSFSSMIYRSITKYLKGNRTRNFEVEGKFEFRGRYPHHRREKG